MLGATGIVLAARRHLPLATALAGAGSAAALEGARRAHEAGLIVPVLVGRPDVVCGLAAGMGWDISAIRLVPAEDDNQAAGIAVSLVRAGEAAALMKGHLHTDALLRAVMEGERPAHRPPADARFSHDA